MKSRTRTHSRIPAPIKICVPVFIAHAFSSKRKKTFSERKGIKNTELIPNTPLRKLKFTEETTMFCKKDKGRVKYSVWYFR